jgi:hypothetical protein
MEILKIAITRRRTKGSIPSLKNNIRLLRQRMLM